MVADFGPIDLRAIASSRRIFRATAAYRILRVTVPTSRHILRAMARCTPRATATTTNPRHRAQLRKPQEVAPAHGSPCRHCSPQLARQPSSWHNRRFGTRDMQRKSSLQPMQRIALQSSCARPRPTMQPKALSLSCAMPPELQHNRCVKQLATWRRQGVSASASKMCPNLNGMGGMAALAVTPLQPQPSTRQYHRRQHQTSIRPQSAAHLVIDHCGRNHTCPKR